MRHGDFLRPDEHPGAARSISRAARREDPWAETARRSEKSPPVRRTAASRARRSGHRASAPAVFAAAAGSVRFAPPLIVVREDPDRSRYQAPVDVARYPSADVATEANVR